MTTRNVERRRTLRAYLQLLRPANVVTALADVLAGYAVAGLPPATPLAWLLGATACLYAGGVVLNDLFDRHVDAQERPERPLPSGLVSPVVAGSLGGMLLMAGVALAWLAGTAPGIVALGIAGAVVCYDKWAKHRAAAGPITMGTCRALNLLLGIAAAPAAVANYWFLALLPLTYIAAITMLSRGEVLGGTAVTARRALWLVGGVLVALVLIAGSATDPVDRVWAVVLTALMAWRLLPHFAAASRSPAPGVIRRAIRTGVLSLVVLDAVIAAAYADVIHSLIVLATGFLALRLARIFAVT